MLLIIETNYELLKMRRENDYELLKCVAKKIEIIEIHMRTTILFLFSNTTNAHIVSGTTA